MDNSEIEAYSIEINDKSWKDEVAPYSITQYLSKKQWKHNPEDIVGDILEKEVIKHIGKLSK